MREIEQLTCGSNSVEHFVSHITDTEAFDDLSDDSDNGVSDR